MMIKKFKFFEGYDENVYVTTFNGDFRGIWNRVALRAMSLYRNDRLCLNVGETRITSEERIIRLLEEEIETNRA